MAWIFGEELTTKSHSSLVTPPTPIQAQQSSHRVTPSASNKTMSHNQENTTPSASKRLTTSSSLRKLSSDMSIPSYESMRRQKFKYFIKIYEKNEA